ncbi:hypothetical protein M9H77_27770 [Catharanthus roseus]|uniref:Uncharacterized protein n=1 Tax=Catharanthus roseus TaxID=4058 RepID=A0ACC0ADF4_CATRO|nr:hypothetical protein M9H77_27770 [Catharanthus roseus]
MVKEKVLTQAGKEILIKNVVQAIPTYVPKLHGFPVLLGMTFVNLKAWSMGFKDFESFSLALLAKQCWRIISSPSSMVATCLQTPPFLRAAFLNRNWLLHQDLTRQVDPSLNGFSLSPYFFSRGPEKNVVDLMILINIAGGKTELAVPRLGHFLVDYGELLGIIERFENSPTHLLAKIAFNTDVPLT